MNNIYLPEAADFGRSHVKNAENFLDFFIKILPKKPGVPCQARKCSPIFWGAYRKASAASLRNSRAVTTISIRRINFEPFLIAVPEPRKPPATLAAATGSATRQ